ncbi:hypothetical protein BDV35DRAFT_65243 [Aspergillus flavus]|uniref:Uncharacterized protein n=1 Tax=Aspergillus flavus TaxID=5059 RepID=A0A5N6GI63_ASPFL|nr:hypothetical protein BDV35DRAFT_65243 [Aspergillus flavus]
MCITDSVRGAPLPSVCRRNGCGEAQLVRCRQHNQKNQPMVCIGLIVSGAVSSNPVRTVVILPTAIAFEMEVAVVWDISRCVTVKEV